jgi:Zn-dependent protease
MPFNCNYCGGKYCSEHRLPERHNCQGIYQYSRSKINQIQIPTTRYYEPRLDQSSFYWFSKRELRDLAIGLAIIISIPLTSFLGRVSMNILTRAIISYTIAFILHELAHKFMAQRLGYWAEFRIIREGLIFTLLSFLSPFKIIAPGAVMIRGNMNLDDYGKISIAGPATNIVLGLISWIFYLMSGSQSLLGMISMSVNGSLAIFNLIPFGAFDGRKILRWNWKVWAIAIVIATIIYASARPF